MKKINVLVFVCLFFVQITFGSNEKPDYNANCRECVVGAVVVLAIIPSITCNLGWRSGKYQGYNLGISNATIAFNSGYQIGFEMCTNPDLIPICGYDIGEEAHCENGIRLGKRDCEAKKEEELKKKLNIIIDKEKIAAFVGDKQMCSNKKKLKNDMSKWLD